MGRVFTQAACESVHPMGTRIELLTGLDVGGFVDVRNFFQNYRWELTLPGQLKEQGYQTVLFTDNFPMLAMYEALDAFGTVYYVPGQGADNHISGKFFKTGDLMPSTFDSVISGCSKLPGEGELDNYVRNQSYYHHLGHPSVRLFKAVTDFLETVEEENCFLVVDCFGLGPPWDGLKEYSRFRNADELKMLAWPVAGGVSPGDREIQGQLNFLRRAYADSCLFIDHLISKIPADGLNLTVMSDHGVLIGDENYLLWEKGQTFPAVARQVLIMCGDGIERGSRCDDIVRPRDIFAMTKS